MDEERVTGTFGSESVMRQRRDAPASHRGGGLEAERVVDIICISVIAVVIGLIAFNWDCFLEGLFVTVLFPVIVLGAQLIGIVLVIALAIGFIALMLNRPGRRY